MLNHNPLQGFEAMIRGENTHVGPHTFFCVVTFKNRLQDIDDFLKLNTGLHYIYSKQ